MTRHPTRRRRRRDPGAAADMLRKYRAPGGSARTPTGGAIGALAQVWPDVVGEVAANHSVPVRRTRAGVVSVACSSGAWAQELTARREELAERLLARLPDAAVTGLRFVVADHVMVVAPTVADTPAPPPPPRPGAAERAAGERAADGIHDDDIRRLVQRAAAVAATRPPRR